MSNLIVIVFDDIEGEGDLVALLAVQGDVKVGRIQQAGGLAVGLVQYLLHVEAGGEGLTELVQHRQFLGPKTSFFEGVGPLDSSSGPQVAAT